MKLFTSLHADEYTPIGICPNCGIDLGLKVHKNEVGLNHVFVIVMALAFVIAILFPSLSQSTGVGSIALIILGVALFSFLVCLMVKLLERGPKPWRRYVAKKPQIEDHNTKKEAV